jgi:hypothetical protein
MSFGPPVQVVGLKLNQSDFLMKRQIQRNSRATGAVEIPRGAGTQPDPHSITHTKTLKANGFLTSLNAIFNMGFDVPPNNDSMP